MLTKDIHTLIATPKDSRNDTWIDDFYTAVLATSFVRGDDFIGPDGFSYGALHIVSSEHTPQKTYTVRGVLGELISGGRGLVIFDRYKNN